MKSIHRLKDLDLYGGYHLHLIITDNIVKERNKYSKDLGMDDLDENDNWVDGLHSYAGKYVMESYIFLTPDSSSGVIAHEALHATLRIMRVIGAKLNRGSEESYAYLLTYIVDEISKMYIELDSKKKKKK